MNREELYESMENIDDDILGRSEENKRKKKRKTPLWMAAVAAVLTVALVIGSLQKNGGDTMHITAYAIEEAEYPKMAPYPNEEASTFDKDYDAWEESIAALRQEPGYADGLEPFLIKSMRQFLSGAGEENRAYSPLNVYMALGMLSELTDGKSRGQILELLNADGIETVRGRAEALFKSHYRNDGATASILANSLWLNQDVPFVDSTMKILAENYYASSYKGEMGSKAFDEALQTWLKEQTGGLLEEQAQNIEMSPETILTLASTVYFRAKWADEFSEDKTAPNTFHSAKGDVACDFMHSEGDGTYYWGDKFGAVTRGLENSGGTMWFLLPDEGVQAEDLLKDEQAMELILSDYQEISKWEQQKFLIINFALPKFDITSELDLTEGLKTLGVTDVFDGAVSDFSPMTGADFNRETEETDGIFVSKAGHDVRVAVDEEGVTAAAYTAMLVCGACEPPEEKMDFVLDRPFVFAIMSDDNLPLFVGIVNRPK